MSTHWSYTTMKHQYLASLLAKCHQLKHSSLSFVSNKEMIKKREHEYNYFIGNNIVVQYKRIVQDTP